MSFASKKTLLDRSAIGLFFTTIGTACLIAIAFHPSRPLTNPNDPGPWLMPTLLGSLLVIGGIGFLVSSAIHSRAHVKSQTSECNPTNWKPWLLLAGVIAYVVALPWIGFLIATPVFVTLMLWRMKIVWWKALAAAVILTAVGQLAFVWGFKTPLPTGFWN